MREFIGHVMKVLADNFPGPVEGVMIDDRPNMVLLKGKDGRVTRVVKSHISGFTPMDSESSEYEPLQILYCENPSIGCPGVNFVKAGEGVTAKDCEPFMEPCPCRSDKCKKGTRGELRSVNGKHLKAMLAGTMYGDYPEKKGA